jgi:hypothetical protein
LREEKDMSRSHRDIILEQKTPVLNFGMLRGHQMNTGTLGATETPVNYSLRKEEEIMGEGIVLRPWFFLASVN